MRFRFIEQYACTFPVRLMCRVLQVSPSGYNAWRSRPESQKVILIHQRRWATREEAKRDLFGYIEAYYNRQRIHSALGYLTPEQAERKAS